MAWLACDKDGAEVIFRDEPTRGSEDWNPFKYHSGRDSDWIYLPSGSIEKLIGRPLTWSDEPVKI